MPPPKNFVNMSEDFDRQDHLQFFAQPYLFKPEYTDDELREMDVLRQNVGSCVSSIARLPYGTLVNAGGRLTQKTFFNKVVIFVFFVCKKYSWSIITLRLNH